MLLVVWFYTLFLVFLVAGTKLLFTFKACYKEFYNEFRCLLWSTTIILTIPLCVRATCDLLTDFRMWNAYWSKSSELLTSYNLLFFILTTYIPIVGQTSSLVFGFLRLIKKESRQQTNQDELDPGRSYRSQMSNYYLTESVDEEDYDDDSIQ